MTHEFIVARNPDPRSKLPYLLRLPLPDGPMWLKAREPWPHTSRVFCQHVDAPPNEVEVLERVAVTYCKRCGPAIDLVLSRKINKRSQFIFAASKGRMLIFWQTAKTATAARPGLRVPTRRSQLVPTIYVDSRERYGYTFGRYGPTVLSRTLAVGDYAAIAGDQVISVVERKAFDDFVTCLTDGSLMFAMAELSSVPAAAVVVEGRYSALFRHEYASQTFLADVLARLHARYPHVPIIFLETRKLAEDWTYRFLRAAYESSDLTLQTDGAVSAGEARA